MKYFLYFTILFALACNPKGKGKLIEANKYKAIVWDMTCADQWTYINSQKDSTTKKDNFTLYQDVFALNGVTKEDFYTTYKYYEQNPKLYKVLMDSVEAYGNRQRQKPVTEQPSNKKDTLASQPLDTVQPKQDSLLPIPDIKYKAKFKKIKPQLERVK